MAQDELTLFFKTLQGELLDGRLDLLAKRFAAPLVVYSIAGVVVFRSKEEIVRRMTMYREALVALSAVSGSVELVSEDSFVNNRVRVTVLPVYFGPDGEEVSRSLVRYYLVRENAQMVVEMIEYLESPLPSDEVERLIH